MKKLGLLTGLTVSVLLLFTTSAFAIVDMKNANFAQTWTDLEVPGSGYDLRVSRTYNSKSLFEGMFGFGWCSDFETRLSFTAEGNLKVTECGAGQEMFFTPRDFSKKEIEKTVSQILEKVKAAKKPDEKTLASLQKDLLADNDLRSKFAFAYKVALPVKEGTTFFANGKEVENIQVAKGIYTRTLSDGSSMRFNTGGFLTHMYDKNGNFLKFEYDKESIREIVDNNGRKLSFKYFNNKKVQKISGPSALTVEYKFEKLDNLSWVKNSWNNVYAFEYDEAHNLTKATFPDKTFYTLTYDKKNDWVMSFQDRNKCQETYKYEFSESDPKMHYWGTVKRVCGKEVVNESKHEFWYSERKDGQTYLQRVASTVNNNITDITYHETFGKPITIRRNNVTYTYEYFPNGQVSNKRTDLARFAYKYFADSGKVSEVAAEAIDAKGKVTNTKKTDFQYDKKGNLTLATNTDGQKVIMTYDTRGRIETITDQAKKIVKIEYEERYGKPSIVTRAGR